MAASMVRGVLRSSSSLDNVFLLAKNQASPLYNVVPVMYMRGKHYDPKFKKLRMEKVFFVNRGELKEQSRDVVEEREREIKKSKGWNKPDPKISRAGSNARSRQDFIIESDTTFDRYIPPEGDGKHSLINKQGIRDAANKMYKKGQARMKAVRKIRKQGEPNFDVKEIAPILQDLYIETLSMLNDFPKNKIRLHDLTTAHAYSLLTAHLDRRTVRWEFLETIEVPKVVHVTCNELIKDMYVAQVTVRLHTKQKLAIYDQFGRLMYGSPHLEKDVLDFVVFEKNIVDLYGRWKVLDKIVPSWSTPEYKNTSIRMQKQELE